MAKRKLDALADRFILKMKEPVFHPNALKQLMAVRKSLLIAIAEIDHFVSLRNTLDSSDVRSLLQKTLEEVDQLIQNQIDSVLRN